MDKPRTPSGPNESNPPWPEDSGSGQDFGATGIFGTVGAPEPGKDKTEFNAEPDPLAKWITESEKSQAPAPIAPPYVPTAAPVPAPPSAPKGFAEPTVHKVVFGGGAAENSPELLDRIRAASAERAAAQRAPAADAGSKGSGGFTELLRTLETEPPATPVAPKETPRPAQDSGFTSLLRTLGTPEVAETPFTPVQPAAPAPGGFTELLRATPAVEVGGPPGPGSGFGEAPPGGTVPRESKAGGFTELFGTLGGANGPAPATETVEPSHSSAGSFTRMLSIEQQSAPVAPGFQEERRPLPGPVDYGAAPRAASPAASSDPFASARLPEAPPSQSVPGGSGMGITRLIQMLDEPSKAPTPHFEPASVSPPPGPEPGVWTQTFASLAKQNEEAATPAKTPDWSSPPAPPAATGYPSAPTAPVGHEAGFNKPAASSASSGPSEFTRILDASKMRELSMKGGAAANLVPAATPPQGFAPAPPQVQMPNFQPPAVPPQVAMHGGGMAQPGGFAPPQAPQIPSYPMNLGAQAPGMPAMGGGMPQAPAIPAPPVPQALPVKPPDAAAGKTQQMLIIMGVVIIVLLVAILVTVIFLMKH